MEIGDALKRFRDESKLTQRQIAEKIGIVQQQWQKYEYKQMMPSAEIIKKIAQAFNVTTDYLLGLSDEPRPKPADAQLVSAIINCRDSIQQVLNEVDRLRGQ